MLIIETSNAVESLHSHLYRACGIIKGSKRLGIMEGLRKLFLYFQDIQRTYFLALGIRYYK